MTKKLSFRYSLVIFILAFMLTMWLSAGTAVGNTTFPAMPQQDQDLLPDATEDIEDQPEQPNGLLDEAKTPQDNTVQRTHNSTPKPSRHSRSIGLALSASVITAAVLTFISVRSSRTGMLGVAPNASQIPSGNTHQPYSIEMPARKQQMIDPGPVSMSPQYRSSTWDDIRHSQIEKSARDKKMAYKHLPDMFERAKEHSESFGSAELPSKKNKKNK